MKETFRPGRKFLPGTSKRDCIGAARKPGSHVRKGVEEGSSNASGNSDGSSKVKVIHVQYRRF